ncbi:MAG: HAMP domain-containing histidine kinase, partial [Parafilimonas terrae]|nr:HAMP domain-containing histidine kinase [Parafilimonas terrae]
GSIREWVGMNTDITPRVEAQQELKRAKERAEEASRAKSLFLANMSHELRTPLNAIIGFADVMENEVLGPIGTSRYTEYARDIRESGGHLLAMIDDILDMAHLEARRVRLRPRTLAADGAVADAVAAVSTEAARKDVRIAVDARPGIELLADVSGAHRILLGILENAVKFTGAGGRIGVRVRRAGDHVHVFVADTGIGIPRAALPRLGQPFTKVETQITSRHKGSGLGLAIARSTAELHGGSLRIRSEENVGTIVLLRLPAPTPRRLEQAAEAAGRDAAVSRIRGPQTRARTAA